MNRIFALVVGVTLVAGCFHATVETGVSPSGESVTKNWASGWIYGLVPPSVVETAARCPSGVARVETQLSFANQLVALLTLGIYTPMSIQVACASRRPGDAEPLVKQGSEFETPEAVLQEATRLSIGLGHAVWVTFE